MAEAKENCALTAQLALSGRRTASHRTKAILSRPMGIVPAYILPFWKSFSATQSFDPAPRFYEAFHFDDHESSANQLAELVLRGTKRATAGLVCV